jgi:hypothetical protein
MSVVLGLSLSLWGRILGEQRDHLLGDTSDMSQRTIQAKRGRITRGLLKQLRDERDRRDHA